MHRETPDTRASNRSSRKNRTVWNIHGDTFGDVNMNKKITIVEVEEQKRISDIEIERCRIASKKAARFNQLVSEVDVVDKRKTRWHVFHDNMLNV